ncbi:hypothetical protein Q4X04_004047 [Salmonella enterica]|nr:hypothetical protein [Salmonella enterica subsp. enterica serovar Agona]ELL6054788.1 hypothetical protein [Salmonella enterica]EHS5384561.1 hypothetical protein [Salmonella enterica subsp. enterica serovar Agona]EHS9993857.1 hypothetical protein [Salmonella enterica subsp. enterica serovar Agona]EIS7025845.1 hypothetical protein [Salmonella enterica subsp. enterica serovar Agona]
MKHCYRCGERKEDDRFRPGQPYWNLWCLRCERTPTGVLPLPQEKEDVWRDSDEVSPTSSVKTANTFQRNTPEINASQSQKNLT